jgi:DNA-binding NarL/FixJ family response regulator
LQHKEPRTAERLTGFSRITGREDVLTMIEDEVVTILAVDDHPIILDGLSFAIASQPGMKMVGEASTGLEAIERFRNLRPRVTLLDLQLPDMNGLDVLTAILHLNPSASVIILTTYSGDVQASRAMKAGASAYLLKSMVRKELVETIARVVRGERYVPASIAAAIEEHKADGFLTPREIDVLKSMSAGRSNKLVADDLNLSIETVKGYMKSILIKLSANDRSHALLIALQRGILES